jgi:hypothetical protein
MSLRLKRPLLAEDSTGETQTAKTQTAETQPARLNRRDSTGETQTARLKRPVPRCKLDGHLKLITAFQGLKRVLFCLDGVF